MAVTTTPTPPTTSAASGENNQHDKEFRPEDDEAILEAYEHCTATDATNWVDFMDLMSRHKFNGDTNYEPDEIKERALHLASLRGTGIATSNDEEYVDVVGDGVNEEKEDEGKEEEDEEVVVVDDGNDNNNEDDTASTHSERSAETASTSNSRHSRHPPPPPATNVPYTPSIDPFELTEAETDLAWLGEESMAVTGRVQFDWEYITAHASPALEKLMNEKKQTVGSYEKAKLNSLVRHAKGVRDAFRERRMENRAILASGGAKPKNGRAVHRNYGGLAPSTIIGINSKYQEDLTEPEMEIAWLGEESMAELGYRYFSWDYIEKNAGPLLLEHFDEIRAERPAAFTSHNKLNALVRGSARISFNAMREEIRDALVKGSNKEESSEESEEEEEEEESEDEEPLSKLQPLKQPKKKHAEYKNVALLPSPAVSGRKQKAAAGTSHQSKSFRHEGKDSDVVPTASKLVQLRTAMKYHHQKGDMVYACWVDGGQNAWYPATVRSSRVVKTTRFGVERVYSVLFDDGDIDPKLDEIFIMSREDYLLSLKHAQEGLRGIRHYTVNTKEDEYAECRGWFESDETGDDVFSSLSDAVHARDDAVVESKGATTSKADLNLPEEWTFFFPRGRSVPVRTEESLDEELQRKRKRGETGDDEEGTDSGDSDDNDGDNDEDESDEDNVALSQLTNKQLQRKRRRAEVSVAEGTTMDVTTGNMDELLEKLSSNQRSYKREVEEYEIHRREVWEEYEKRRRDEWERFVREEKKSRQDHMKRCNVFVARMKQIGKRVKEVAAEE